MPPAMDDLHARLLSLPQASHRHMFGSDCFLAGGRMFAFLAPDGLVLRLPEERYQEALSLPGVHPFTMRGVPFGKWARFPASDAPSLLPWLRAAHAQALAQPPRSSRKRAPAP